MPPTDDELLSLFCTHKLELIRNDPVAIVRFLNIKLKWILNNLLQTDSSPLRKVLDYFGFVEAQNRGSLYLHFMLFVEGAPDVKGDSDSEVISFIDKLISTSIELSGFGGLALSDEDKRLPLKFQLHSHRDNRTRKCMHCHYVFPNFLMKETLILWRLPVNICLEELNQYSAHLEKVVDVLRKMPKGERCTHPFKSFLDLCGITYDTYLRDIRSNVSKTTIFLKREPNAIYLNPVLTFGAETLILDTYLTFIQL